MAENTTDLKVEIKGLKKDIEASNNLSVRLDTAIEKLTDVSTSIKSMLAVHEEKISRQEQIDEIIFDKLKERAADIEPKKNSIVPGGLFEISKSDEKKLDLYEDFPILYKKFYFEYYGKKVMTYTMVKKTPFRYPTERYLNVVKRGYRDCGLDFKYLKKGLISI